MFLAFFSIRDRFLVYYFSENEKIWVVNEYRFSFGITVAEAAHHINSVLDQGSTTRGMEKYLYENFKLISLEKNHYECIIYVRSGCSLFE